MASAMATGPTGFVFDLLFTDRLAGLALLLVCCVE